MELAVNISGLTVAYNRNPVLWDVNLEIPCGCLAAVVGPNGAGKSTMLKAVLGLIKPVSGTIEFPGNVKIGYVPQSESVDWDFPTTVLDTVLMGRYAHIGWLRRPGKTDRALAMETLQKVGMAQYHNRQISQLSGGQQQRVFLARALVQQADIYFMDEPFKGVDAQTEKAIVTLLQELRDDGKTVVVVHHDLQTVPQYFDWVTLVNRCVIASGPVSQVFHEKNLRETYHTGHVPLEEEG